MDPKTQMLTNDTGKPGNVTSPEEDGESFNQLAYCLIMAAITLIGVVGNCLNIVIYSSRSFRGESLSVYIRALAVSDSLVLITTLADDTVTRLFSEDILHGTKSVCSLILFIQWFLPILSSTLLVAVAVDRYIAVAHPLKRASMCTPRRGVITTTGIVVCCALVALPELIWDKVITTATHTPGEEYFCPYLDSLDAHLTITIYSFMFILFLPFTTILILNIRVICILRSGMKAQATDKKSNSRSLARVTVPVIGMTICSITLLLPILIVEIVEFVFQRVDVSPEQQRPVDTAWDTTNVIRLLNYSLNFYFFMLFSKNHRNTLKNVCSSCGNHHAGNSKGELPEKYISNTADTKF